MTTEQVLMICSSTLTAMLDIEQLDDDRGFVPEGPIYAVFQGYGLATFQAAIRALKKAGYIEDGPFAHTLALTEKGRELAREIDARAKAASN